MTSTLITLLLNSLAASECILPMIIMMHEGSSHVKDWLGAVTIALEMIADPNYYKCDNRAILGTHGLV